MRRSFFDVVGSSFRNAAPISFAPPGSGRGFGGSLLGRPSGMQAQMRAQGSSGVLFAIVDRIITSYSQVEWKLYRKAASGLEEDRTEVTRHAALDLIRQPNAFMTGPAFRETAQQHEELTGEQWWIIARNPAAKVPLELWPVRPDRMRPVPDPVEFISGYEYIGPSGEIIPLGLDEVIFLRRPNPLDPYRGLGPVQTVLTDLDSVRYGTEWNRNFFVNGAEPGGILQVEKRLSDDEFNEARERWTEQHRGVANAHRVAILENGITWQDRKYTARDMQFVELTTVGDEKIRQAFGFPKPMLGSVDDVNRANAEAAEVVFARWLLVPRLERLKAALNTRLLPLYGTTGQGLEFDYCNPVPDDVEAEAAQLTARATAAQALIAAGAYGPSVLNAVGLPDSIEFGQPGADPQRDLLVELVKGGHIDAEIVLPLLGYDLSAAQAASTPMALAELVQKIYLGVGTVLTEEEARQILVAAGADINPATPATKAVPAAPVAAPPATAAVPQDATWEGAVSALVEPENAMRWVVKAMDDDNTCQPCRDNDGHLYRNREDAYADYPGGTGYINCVGAKYGNDCRCTVVKRRKGNDGNEEDS